MKVWTYQSPSFDIFAGTVDHTKSNYAADVDEYLPAVRELSEYLGTDQFIWATCKSDSWRGRDQYELDVPDEKLLGILDGFLWNRRLGLGVRPPRADRVRWEQEAKRLFPQDGNARRCYIDDKENEYRAERSPSEWLAKALELGPCSENPQYLVPFPVLCDCCCIK